MRPGRQMVRLTVLAGGVVVVAACSSPADGGADTAPDVHSGADVENRPEGDAADTGREIDGADDVSKEVGADGGQVELERNCDPLNTARCALPWPSNLYLADDDSRETGATLTFGPEALPAAQNGDPVDPQPWRRLDGYGVGTPAMVAFEDLDTSGMPDEDQVTDSLDDGAQVLWFEVKDDGSMTRVPWWAEIDRKADDDAAKKVLFVRPAIILEKNTRYIVAFRNLERQNGGPIPAPEAFRKLRAGDTTDRPQLAARQARFDDIFAKLEGAGVAVDDLTLAWDFRTASSQALHGRMLQMRDRGTEIVGADGPELSIDQVTEYARPGQAQDGESTDDDIAFEIEGTFRVPRFMKRGGIRGREGWVFNLDDGGSPVQNGWKESPFWLTIPHSAVADTAADAEPHGLVEYGHGLMGSGEQVEGGFNDSIANEYGYIFFGANLYGMATDDVVSALNALSDVSRFPFMADRLHQGMLEYLLLMQGMGGRLEQTLADHPATADANITVDTSRTFYSGISQGGIFGGTFMALSRQVTRGHLGVPGNNYSLLLDRSVDFNDYFGVLKQNYPNRIDQVINVQLIQLLWAQTDPVSYLRHIKAEPFPDTPEHDVLVAPAKGDHQVTPIANEIAARSPNAIEMMAGYDGERDLIVPKGYPHAGSGVVLYDFGNPWPEAGNKPPDDDIGDPHGKPRDVAAHNRQMVHFFETGQIIDVCTEYTPDKKAACSESGP